MDTPLTFEIVGPQVAQKSSTITNFHTTSSSPLDVDGLYEVRLTKKVLMAWMNHFKQTMRVSTFRQMRRLRVLNTALTTWVRKMQRAKQTNMAKVFYRLSTLRHEFDDNIVTGLTILHARLNSGKKHLKVGY